jgi:hypothetical protein
MITSYDMQAIIFLPGLKGCAGVIRAAGQKKKSKVVEMPNSRIYNYEPIYILKV